MDKDPVSSCLHCNFMTYSTERMKIHSLSTHPGELEKSILKAITKSVSARVRQDDAVYYSSFVDDEGDTSILDVKPNDLTFQTHSSSVTSVNDPGEEEVCKNEPKSSQNLSQHGNPLIKFYDCKVEKVNMMCVLCAYENTNIEKMKCHLITQHSTESATVANKLDETSQKLSGTAFFCIKESCSHVTMSCNNYEEHLMSCCPIHQNLSQVEIERLKSSLRYILKFLRGNSLEPVSGFLNFVSAFKVVHDIHDDVFLTQTANPEVSQTKNHFLINNNVSNIKNQHSHLMDSQSYEHPSLSCQNENTILGNVANSNPEIGHTVDNFLLNDISDVQNNVHYDVQNDIKNDVQNNVQINVQNEHSNYVIKTKEKREKIDSFQKIATEIEGFSQSPKYLSLSCQNENTFSRNIVNLNFEGSHTVSDVGNQHSNYMNAAKEKGQINSFGKMSAEIESLSESPGLPSSSCQNEDATASSLAAQYNIFNVETQELNFSQAQISEHNQQSDKNGNRGPETTPTLSPDSLVAPLFLNSSLDVHTATGSEHNHTLKSGHLVDKSQDYNSVDGQLYSTTNNIGTEFLSEMSINSKENVDNTNTVISSNEGNTTHDVSCSGLIHTPKDISSVNSADIIQGYTQNLSETSPIPVNLDPNIAADKTGTNDISCNEHSTLSVKHKVNEDEQSKKERFASRNFSSSSEREMILDESGHNYFVSGNASLDIENGKDTTTDCVENNMYDNDGIILKALPRTQREQGQSLDKLSSGKNIMKKSNQHLDNFPRKMVPKSGGRKLSLRKAKMRKENNGKCNLNNLKDKFDSIIFHPRVIIEKLNLTSMSGTVFIDSAGNLIEASSEDKSTVNSLDSANGVKKVSHKHGQSVTECGLRSNLITQVRVESTPTLDKCPNDIILCQLCDLAFPSSLLLEQHTKSLHDGQHSLVKGDGQQSLAIRKGQHSLTKYKNREDLKEDKLRTMTNLQSNGVPMVKKLKGNLRKHRETHFKSLVKSDKLKDQRGTLTIENTFTCRYCGKSYDKSGKLKRHIRSHTGEKPVNCNVCDRVFDFKSEMKKHMRIHTGEKPFKCKDCGKSFSSNQSLKAHIRLHTGEKPFKCSTCGKSFRYKSSLTKHITLHTGIKRFKCNDCGKSFSHLHILKMHIRTHAGNIPFKCNHCDKSFHFESRLKRHLSCHTGEKPFKCIYCGIWFGRKFALMVHIRTHTGERPFKCNYCGKSFYSKNIFRDHLVCHTGEKPFKCNICGKSFSRSCALTVHKRTVCYTVEDPIKSTDVSKNLEKNGTPKVNMGVNREINIYKCSYCGKRCGSSYNLKNHERTHTKEEPFKCHICGRTFKQSSNLKSHIQTHSEERPFKCNTCGKTYKRRHALKTHMITHNTNIKFKCDICGRILRRKHSFRVHMRLHDPNNPFKCKDCGRICSSEGQLIAHQRTHTGEEPFKCNECGKAFKINSNLRIHTQIHKRERSFKCKDCGRICISNYHLKSHQRTHTKEPIKCNECGKTFTENYNLKIHARIHR